jgi:DHA1 family tetracycline resistance protein-like MFS transporter
MSSQVPPTEQGELQGALTSLMSITMIIGPLFMTNIFAVFTHKDTGIYFPGAPFIAGSVLLVTGVFIAISSLSGRRLVATK